MASNTGDVDLLSYLRANLLSTLTNIDNSDIEVSEGPVTVRVSARLEFAPPVIDPDAWGDRDELARAIGDAFTAAAQAVIRRQQAHYVGLIDRAQQAAQTQQRGETGDRRTSR